MFGFTVVGGKLHIVNEKDLGYPESDIPVDSDETVSQVLTPWASKDYCEEIQKSLSWIRNLGVSVPADGRHEKYIRTIEENASAVDGKKDSDYISHELDMAMYETHEFSRIRRNFLGTETSGLKDKLRKYVGGPPLYTEEKPGDESGDARNYGLELAIGGEMLMYGLPVSYGNRIYPEPMVHATVGNYAMQCKRISSTSDYAIQRNLRKAANQLKRNIDADRDIRAGIIVVDITKRVNPNGARRVKENMTDQNSPIRTEMRAIRDVESQKFDFSEFAEVEAIIFRATYPRRSAGEVRNDEWVCRTTSWVRPEGGLFCELLYERYKSVTRERVESVRLARAKNGSEEPDV